MTDNTAVQASQGKISVDYGKGTVLYLLEDVVLPVGLMYFSNVLLEVDGCCVDLRVESLPCPGKYVALSYLGLYAEVEVSRIVPPSDVQIGPV